MTRFSATFSGRTGLAAVPLAVAYGAVPLGYAAARYAGGPGEVSAVLPWLLLAGIGALLSMYRAKPGAPRKAGFWFKATLLLILAAGMVIYAGDVMAELSPYLPYLRELSPLVFLLCGGLWAATCGLPDRADFQRFGALLGVICLIDLAVEIFLYQAVPSIRWVGNADVLAGLMLVSVCAGLKPGENDGGLFEPDQGRPGWRWLTLLGLLACLSRTGLFAAGWVVLCFGRGKLRYRFLYSLVCAGLLALTFFLPATASDAVRYTDYWLWMEALRLFAESPILLVTGLPIDAPLPIRFPVNMGILWEAATGQPSIFGVFLSQVPSFWLRLIMAWGAAVPLSLLLFMFILLFGRLTRMGAGLMAALFAQAMATPLLFDPAMAMTVGLGFMLALSRPESRPNVRRSESEAPVSEQAPESESPDPAKEWNLKPL